MTTINDGSPWRGAIKRPLTPRKQILDLYKSGKANDILFLLNGAFFRHMALLTIIRYREANFNSREFQQGKLPCTVFKGLQWQHP